MKKGKQKKGKQDVLSKLRGIKAKEQNQNIDDEEEKIDLGQEWKDMEEKLYPDDLGISSIRSKIKAKVVKKKSSKNRVESKKKKVKTVVKEKKVKNKKKKRTKRHTETASMGLNGTRGWVCWDIETADTVEKYGGWGHIGKLTHAYTVTYCPFDGYMLFLKGEEVELIDYLNQFDRNITHNGDRFDIKVMEKYADVKRLKKTSWDLLVKIRRSCGSRVALMQVGKGLPTPKTKTADGLAAVAWWNSRSLEKRIDGFMYCKGDTEILVEAIDIIKKKGMLNIELKTEMKEVKLIWEEQV